MNNNLTRVEKNSEGNYTFTILSSDGRLLHTGTAATRAGAIAQARNLLKKVFQ